MNYYGTRGCAPARVKQTLRGARYDPGLLIHFNLCAVLTRWDRDSGPWGAQHDYPCGAGWVQRADRCNNRQSVGIS